MKLAVDRTIVLGRPPLEMAAQADGTFAIAFCHDGVRLVAVLSPNEATAFGVGIIKGAAIAEAVRESAKPAQAGAAGTSSPLAIATGGNGGSGA